MHKELVNLTCPFIGYPKRRTLKRFEKLVEINTRNSPISFLFYNLLRDTVIQHKNYQNKYS